MEIVLNRINIYHDDPRLYGRNKQRFGRLFRSETATDSSPNTSIIVVSSSADEFKTNDGGEPRQSSVGGEETKRKTHAAERFGSNKRAKGRNLVCHVQFVRTRAGRSTLPVLSAHLKQRLATETESLKALRKQPTPECRSKQEN